jgi:hypothetical protein
MARGWWYSSVLVSFCFLLMGLALACGSPSDSDASSTLVKADSTPPLIEAIHVSDITSSSATITFRTNEEASCQVRCDRMARGMASESEATELDTEHKIMGINLLDTFPPA